MGKENILVFLWKGMDRIGSGFNFHWENGEVNICVCFLEHPVELTC